MTTAFGPVGLPVVQVHLTRHCNLRCRHCYTSSGPAERQALDTETIRRFLADARREGYRHVSFSGGEPLMHPAFFDCVAEARALGFSVSVATNGMLIDTDCAERMAHRLDSIAISIDGPRAMHNAMRSSPAAYDGALRGIDRLRKAKAEYAIIHTVTDESLRHLRWLYETALALGARSMQLHLLQDVGRASDELAEVMPKSDLATRTSLLASLLSSTVPQGPIVQVDVLSTEMMKAFPEIVFAGQNDATDSPPLSQLINPLVLDPDGSVLPVTSGLSSRFQVCTLQQQSLRQAASAFRREGYPAFRKLCRKLYDKTVAAYDLPYFDWYSALVAMSHQRSG